MVTGGEERRPDEQGVGLVELIVATALTVVAIGVVATTALGPIAGPTALMAGPTGEVPPLLRDAVVAAVRSARGGPSAPGVVAAGPDHLVLRRDPGDSWWRLTLLDGAAVIDDGLGPAPAGPATPGTGRVLVDDIDPDMRVVLRDRSGRVVDVEWSGTGRATLVELGTPDGGPGGGIAVALRDPGRPW